MNPEMLEGLGYDQLCDGVYTCTRPVHSLLDLPDLTNSQILPHDSSGTIVWDIKPETRRAARSQTMDEFEMHTDASFDNLPPRYIGLEVVQEDRFGGGSQAFLPLSSIIAAIKDEEREVLGHDYSWFVAPEFAMSSQRIVELPILFGDSHQQFVRYREDCVILQRVSPEHRAAFHGLRKVIKQASPVVLIPRKGNQIVIDNWRVLHARKAVQDPNRHIKRIRFC